MQIKDYPLKKGHPWMNFLLVLFHNKNLGSAAKIQIEQLFGNSLLKKFE